MICQRFHIKDTYSEKALSKILQHLHTKSMNIDIWFVGTSNQLLIIGS